MIRIMLYMYKIKGVTELEIPAIAIFPGGKKNYIALFASTGKNFVRQNLSNLPNSRKMP